MRKLMVIAEFLIGLAGATLGVSQLIGLTMAGLMGGPEVTHSSMFLTNGWIAEVQFFVGLAVSGRAFVNDYCWATCARMANIAPWYTRPIWQARAWLLG